jgi:hypothetical protein
MKHAIVTVIIFLITLVLGISYVIHDRKTQVDLDKEEGVAVDSTDGIDPLNTAYVIDGETVLLKDGVSDVEIAGSAARIQTQVFGEPKWGDINGDGKDDALLLLVQGTGGSGVFYYAAAAIASDTGYVGTETVYIGDRIAPQTLEIRNGVMIVNYADRNEDEPFSTPPSRGRSVYLTYTNERLDRVDQFADDEMVLFGNIVMGHEVREFVPCGEGQPQYWVSGDSPVYQELLDVYTASTDSVKVYRPLFAVVVGKIVDAPEDGFGADFENAIEVSQIVRVDPIGNCKSDNIVVLSPSAGSIVDSPLQISGRARGTWFFEASFPISIVDWDGRIVGEGYATALDDWMTTSFVPFEATIEFEDPTYSDRGNIIFKKDNPSGLPEFDDAYEMPIIFDNLLEAVG